MESVKINNKRVYAFESKSKLLEFVEGKNQILVSINAEKLVRSDPGLDAIINSNIGITDGIGAVWAVKRKGLKAVKIAGAEFWLDIIKTYNTTKSFYLIGATQTVIEQTVEKLRNDFPNIDIKGFRNGFLGPEDEETVLNDIQIRNPDVVFVAMGSPKQEFLMNRFLKTHNALYMGLGGSFDVYSGTKKRAPKIFLDLGLEWLYRLLKEPTRISRQLNLVKFFFKIIFDKM